jgi:hypothetical protein
MVRAVRRSSVALLALALALPGLVLVPWALFGDVVPRSLLGAFGPRALARLTLVAAGLSIALLAIAITRLVREARRSPDPRKATRRLVLFGLGLVGLGVATAGGVFAWYIREHDRATELCRGAEGAPATAAWRKALRRAEEHRARVAFLNESAFACDELERELARLDRGECPRLPPDDAHCRCGSDRFPEDWLGPGRARCDSFDDAGELAGAEHLHRRARWDPP